jgi:hypothetical protein
VAFRRFGHGRGRWVRVSQRLHGYFSMHFGSGEVSRAVRLIELSVKHEPEY